MFKKIPVAQTTEVDVDAEIATLNAERREQVAAREEQLHLVGVEPGAAKKARDAKNRIAAIDEELSEFDAVLEARRKAQRDAETAARHAATEAQRQSAVIGADSRAAKLAPHIDAKFDELIDLLVQYRKAGEPIAADTRASVDVMHKGDDRKRLNTLTHLLPVARGRSRATSSALAPFIYRVVKMLQPDCIDEWVAVNDNAARSKTTFAGAAIAEAKQLRTALKVD